MAIQLRQRKVQDEEIINIGKRYDKKIAVPSIKNIAGVEKFGETVDTRGLLEADLERYLNNYLQKRHELGMADLPQNWLKDTLRSAKSPSCQDSNAGAFHIIMANQIGHAHKGFILDIARDVEVWNHPAYRYSSIITPLDTVTKTAARGTKRNVLVKTKLWYADDTYYGFDFSKPALELFLNPGLNPLKFLQEYTQYEDLLVKNGDRETPGQYPEDILESIDYEYTLDLGDNDEILGGDWVTYDRPDYLWIIKQQPIAPTFSRISELLNID